MRNRVIMPVLPSKVMVTKTPSNHLNSQVGYGDVEYKNVMIEGPRGVIRTSNIGTNDYGDPEGILYKACVRDAEDDRVLDNLYRNNDMTVEASRRIYVFIQTITSRMSIYVPSNHYGK